MKTKRINLALQGGGAHGAFTWGVLDRLLQEDWLEISGVSGTSAGALNAAVLKEGLSRGKRSEARAMLDALWGRVAGVQDYRLSRWMEAMFPVPRPMQRLAQAFSPAAWMDALTRVFSPYDSGPFYINPLASIVEEFDFARITCAEGPQLYVSATNVRTGKIRVFSGKEISPEVLMASACLPTVFRAVELIDPATGQLEAYWDGGFSGNPALFPLFGMDLPPDILLVNINPLRREEVPQTPSQIEDRVNEISFNASILRELRAINFVKRLIAEGKVEKGGMKDVLVHLLADDDLMIRLGVASKMMADRELMGQMKLAGQAAADVFLSKHAADINERSTVDLTAMFS
ncbi:patatin-like phospholipase family protein [Phaeovulum sp. W22_SRMD_FR3]|uniref:patatin-like phospholipase family protein n=1 Tax=Phaeovulum sp. W22_SRMD_FR3 TaxID=3240274 RepID=UPI003F9A9DE3